MSGPENSEDNSLPSIRKFDLIMRHIGGRAAKLSLPDLDEKSVVPVVIEQPDTGMVHFRAQHKFISTPDAIPLTKGPINPNHN